MSVGFHWLPACPSAYKKGISLPSFSWDVSCPLPGAAVASISIPICLSVRRAIATPLIARGGLDPVVVHLAQLLTPTKRSLGRGCHASSRLDSTGSAVDESEHFPAPRFLTNPHRGACSRRPVRSHLHNGRSRQRWVVEGDKANLLFLCLRELIGKLQTSPAFSSVCLARRDAAQQRFRCHGDDLVTLAGLGQIAGIRLAFLRPRVPFLLVPFHVASRRTRLAPSIPVLVLSHTINCLERTSSCLREYRGIEHQHQPDRSRLLISSRALPLSSSFSTNSPSFFQDPLVSLALFFREPFFSSSSSSKR